MLPYYSLLPQCNYNHFGIREFDGSKYWEQEGTAMTVPTPTSIATKDGEAAAMDQQVTEETTAVDRTEIRPRKRQKPNGSARYHTATLPSPRWTYFHLQLLTSSTSSSNPTTDEPALDAITARRYLSAALSRSLGQMGAATPVDVLKIEQRHVWIRVPSDDATTVHEAVSSWASHQGGTGDGTGLRWIIHGRDDWLVRLGGGKGGQDLFAT